jgi:nucleoside-diphosphate kinase
LDEGFEISAMEIFNLDRPTADEFFELYKGIVPEYSSMVDHMISGPCLVLEIRQENVISQFKNIAGSYDPNIGR